MPSPSEVRQQGTSTTPFETEWEKTYGGDNYETTEAAIEVPEAYLFTGRTRSSTVAELHSDAWLVKVDREGSLLWEATYDAGSPDNVYTAVIEASNGGYLTAGVSGTDAAEAVLVKYRTDGTREWAKTYPGAPSINRTTAISLLESDDGYLFTGHAERTDDVAAWLVHVDRRGDVEWQQRYGTTDGSIVGKSVLPAEDGYVVAGRQSVPSRTWVMKVSSNGRQQWRQMYDRPIASIVRTHDDGFLLVGRESPRVLRIDADGQVLWEVVHEDLELNLGYRSVSVMNDGYLVVGNRSDPDDELLVAKLNQEGGIVWRGYYGDQIREHDSSLISTADNGCLVASSTRPPGQSTDALLLKLASSPDEPSGVSTALEDVQAEKLELAHLVDELSLAAFDDHERVDPLLKSYREAVTAGELTASTAKAGIDRLRLGELVTRDALVAIGSADPDWWLGSPHLAAATAEPTLWTIVNFLLLKSALARKIKAKLDRFDTVVESALDRLETGLSRLATLMAGASTAAEHAGMTEVAVIIDDIYERVDQDALGTVKEVEAAIESALEPVIAVVAAALQRYVEQAAPIHGAETGLITGLNGSLDYLHAELTVEAATTGVPGEFDAAFQAKAAASASIKGTVSDAAEMFDRFDRLVDGLGTVETFLETMEGVTPDSGIREDIGLVYDSIALVKELVKIIGDAFQTGYGAAALDSIARVHHGAIEDIVNGRSPN